VEEEKRVHKAIVKGSTKREGEKDMSSNSHLQKIKRI
jgi:hypothetical protein